MVLGMVDTSCLIAAVLMVGSTLLTTSFYIKYSMREHFSYDDMTSLDVDFIRDEWDFRRSHRGLEMSSGIVNALSWLVLTLPILRVAFIQQQQQILLSVSSSSSDDTDTSKPFVSGTVWNCAIVVFVLSGSLTEFLARLLEIGTINVSEWISKSFDLEQWWTTRTTNTDEFDYVGWKMLEVMRYGLGGMLLWVNAMEFLFIFGVMAMIYLSVRAQAAATTTAATITTQSWSPQWINFGLIVGAVSAVDFCVEILRFGAWRAFSDLSLIISLTNRIFLIPLWLLWLGRQLPTIEQDLVPRKHKIWSSNTGTISSEAVLT